MKIKVKCDKCDEEFKTEISDSAKGYDYHTHLADKTPIKYIAGKKSKPTKKGTYEEEVTCPRCGAQLHLDYNLTEEEPKRCASWVCLYKSTGTPVSRPFT